MAKSASKTSSELSALHFDRKLTKAVKDCASACGKSSVSNKTADTAKRKAQEELLKVMRVWLTASKKILTNPALLNEMVTKSIEDGKKLAGEAAAEEWQNLTDLYKNKPERQPSGSKRDAKKNGSKGLRQRRRDLENFQELVGLDLEAAKDSVRKRADNEPKLPWTEKCKMWETAKVVRCSSSKNKIVVGVDKDENVHVLGEHYKKNYVVQTREVDGEEEEYCEVSVGPNGAKEEIQVVIGLQEEGKLFAESLELLEKSRRLITNRGKFVKDSLDEQTLENCQIPEQAKRD
jgi:hypothetical protein